MGSYPIVLASEAEAQKRIYLLYNFQ